MLNKKSFSSVKVLTSAAMLTAFSVIIGIVCKNFLTFNVYYRITFENLPIILAGIMFGPTVGGTVGVAADIVSCLCSTNPAVNPLITIGAFSVGVISGVVPRLFRKRGKSQIAFTVFFAHIIGQVIIKSVAKMIWFAMPWYGIFIGIGFSAVAGTVEFLAICWITENKNIATLCGGDLR